jgi:hypothetical protein
MPWSVKRDQSVLRVEVRDPMDGEWQSLMDAVDSKFDPTPIAVYLPARIPSASETDAEMLKQLWKTIADRGVTIMPG